MNSKIYPNRRYPRVSQTHQLPMNNMQQPASSNTLNNVPAGEPKFYSIPSALQSGNVSESWVPQNLASHQPVQSQQLPPQEGYWQQPYPTAQNFSNESWKWNTSNSGENLNNHFQQHSDWQQVPLQPYQTSNTVYNNQTYAYQPALNQGTYSEYSHPHSWINPSMDSNTNTKMDMPTDNSQQQPWQFSSSSDTQNQSRHWPHSDMQSSETFQWSGDENPQNSNINVIGDSWNNQVSQCTTLPTEKFQQVDSNFQHYSRDNSYVVESSYNTDDTHVSSRSFEYSVTESNVDVQCLKTDSDCSKSINGGNSIQRDLSAGDQGSSSLSAFFNDDLSHEIQCADDPSSGTPVPEEGKECNIPSSEQIQVANVNQPPSIVNPLMDESNLFITPDRNASLESKNFVQNESNHSVCDENSQAFSTTGFTEEPLNQEVPEPSPSGISMSVKQSTHTLLQDTKNESFKIQSSGVELSEEPHNQQIPVVIGENSGTSVTEPEHVVIRAREESPFKPPPKLSNSKEKNFQHDDNLLPLTSHEFETNSIGNVNEVNLETVPDNLERPPDTEEQKKQSSWVNFHRHHIRNMSDSSSSTSLWESPDIPCVTLIPATPLVSSFPVRAVPKDSEQSPCALHNLADTKITGCAKSLDNEDAKTFTSKPPAPPEEILRPLELLNASLSATAVSCTSQLDQQFHNSPASVPHEKTFYNNSSKKNISRSQKFKVKEYLNPGSFDSSTQDNAVSSGSSISASVTNLSRENMDKQQSSFYETPHESSRNSEFERDPHASRQKLADNRCSSFDERNYFAERERSRPSSRMSLHEPPDRRVVQEQDPRKAFPPHYDRAPSRMSESEAVPPGKFAPSYPYYEPPYYDDRYPGYSRDDEYYHSNRNYRGGYDYDPYRQERNPFYAHFDPYRYSYSSYNYGFYDELYRNDARYRQEVEEYYRQYYAKLGYEIDQEKSGMHSGRSSATELTKDIHTGHPYTEPDQNSNDSESSTYNQQYYGYGNLSKLSSLDVSTEQVTAVRLTPAKFSCPHPICRFSSGGKLVAVIPSQAGNSQPPLIEFHSVQIIMEKFESHRELKHYQGPLVRSQTHKNDVIEFCLQKIKKFSERQDLPDRESYVLLWQLMVLLLRQNGSVAGSDIAELLLKDHEVLRPSSSPAKHNVETPQGDNSASYVGESSNHATSGDTSSPDEGIVLSRDKTIIASSSSLDVNKITRKFREFLLFGHKKDALEWAMEHGLWGHALFLASKMDLRTYANVMTRFANSLELNDPLQTLYQLMSGRQPAAVTCLADEKWGDWRPHLAMVLSNPSPHPEVDSRSITALGDTLAARGCLPAAHFCYLMAQVEFGIFSRKSSKMVLLSSNHLFPFDEFATNEAIQCSEIYEYAQSLANPGYMLPHLQAYKFIYATRLAEHGFLQEALHYCEVISDNFHCNSSLFPVGLISEVHELATRLKYHDPMYMQGQGEWEEQGDPEWLHKLTLLLCSCQDNVAEPLADYGNATEFMPNSNVESSGSTSGEAHVLPDPEIKNQNLYSPSVLQNVYHGAHWEALSSVQQPEMQPPAETVPSQDINHATSGLASNQWNLNSDNHISFEEAERIKDISSSLNQSASSSCDYYGASIQSSHAMRQNSRERKNSSSSIGTQRDRQDSNVSSSSIYGIRPPANTANKDVQETSRKLNRKEEKSKSQQVGKTWLGGIFSKLMPKGPNQMILPDDKNPAIIWDSAKNCWVNTDSTEDDDAIKPIAPPTDYELMGKSNPTDLPQAPIMPSKNKFQRPKARGMRQNYVDILNPNTNSNSSIKSSMGNEILFPPPPQQTSASKLFIPSVPAAEDNPTDFVSSGQSMLTSSPVENENVLQLGSPLMLDPAEFDSRRSSIGSIRHSVGPAGRRTYPT